MSIKIGIYKNTKRQVCSMGRTGKSKAKISGVVDPKYSDKTVHIQGGIAIGCNMFLCHSSNCHFSVEIIIDCM